MLLNAFTVYDSKAEAYLPPFFFTTTALAIRSFETAANQEEHDFHKYAADFTLFKIGNFDDHSGRIDSLDSFENLGTALTFIRNEPLVQRALTTLVDLDRKETA